MIHHFDIQAPLDPRERMEDLFYAYFRHQGSVIIHSGEVEGIAAIVLDLEGAHHILLAHEASGFADSLEKTMSLQPNFPGNDVVADLIMALRLGVTEAEKVCSTLSTSSSSASSSA